MWLPFVAEVMLTTLLLVIVLVLVVRGDYEPPGCWTAGIDVFQVILQEVLCADEDFTTREQQSSSMRIEEWHGNVELEARSICCSQPRNPRVWGNSAKTPIVTSSSCRLTTESKKLA